jgi:hypothetical protein
MPLYSFKHPETGEQKDILMSMDDEHKFVDENGVEWERIFYVPQAAMDINVDPFNRVKFLEKTSKPGSMGDLWDRSKELSNKREQKRGVDEVRQKYFDDFRKERNGRMHPAERAEKNKGEIVI